MTKNWQLGEIMDAHVIAALTLLAVGIIFSVYFGTFLLRRLLLGHYRVAYRRGYLAGKRRALRTEELRIRRELHNAQRKSVVRPDAGLAAKVTKIKYHSGP